MKFLFFLFCANYSNTERAGRLSKPTISPEQSIRNVCGFLIRLGLLWIYLDLPRVAAVIKKRIDYCSGENGSYNIILNKRFLLANHLRWMYNKHGERRLFLYTYPFETVQ